MMYLISQLIQGYSAKKSLIKFINWQNNRNWKELVIFSLLFLYLNGSNNRAGSIGTKALAANPVCMSGDVPVRRKQQFQTQLKLLENGSLADTESQNRKNKNQLILQLSSTCVNMS